MYEAYIPVSAGGSLLFRIHLTDCDGVEVTADMISKIEFNLFELLPPANPVEGYTKLEIPISAFLSAAQTDENGKKFNVEFNPYITGKPMFPKRFTSYGAETIFYDLNGKPSAHQIRVDAI